ncbi:MAG TPA: glycosyltransferase family 4 protein [archaeon]|nr:glycosyltransferase family 4 protein [archaeon]
MVRKVTLLGTLPPIKGISDYCIEQARTLGLKINVVFLNFKAIYPEFLYPGGTKENDPSFRAPESQNIEVRNILAWYNPFSWVSAGFGAEGEIFHFHWWTYFLFPVVFTVALIAKLRGKKIVCTVHNVIAHESNFLDRLLTGTMFMLPDRFIVHTQKNMEQLRGAYNIKQSAISVIPQGVYAFYLGKKVSKAEARKKLGIPGKARAVLYFGNIRKYKGVEDFIEAFKIAVEKDRSLFLVIAGRPWKEELRNSINSSVKGIKGKKIVLDYIASSDIKYFFEAADVVVLPYRNFTAQSALGNIALAFGKPMIVSDAGGLPELVLDRKMVFRAGNPEGLASKIMLAFSEKGLLQSMALDSKKLGQKYSWESISDSTIKLYDALLRQ